MVYLHLLQSTAKFIGPTNAKPIVVLDNVSLYDIYCSHMMAISRDRAISDFLGTEHGVEIAQRQPQVALAKDNARLFVGNVINNYARPPNQDAFSIDGYSVNSSLVLDPVLMTSKVLKAVINVTDILRTCQRKAAKVKIADLSIASLHTECSSLRLRLNQIKSLISREDDVTIEERYEVYILEEYEDVLHACRLPFSILTRHLEKLGLSDLQSVSRDDLKSRLQEFWAYERMEMVCHNIRGLSRAVDILCSAFQSETTTKASNIIGNPTVKKLLESIGNDALSLHNSFESAKGIHERSIRESIATNEVFEFDNILTNTTLYRKAYIRQNVRAQISDMIGDEGSQLVDNIATDPNPTTTESETTKETGHKGKELVHGNQTLAYDGNENLFQDKLGLGESHESQDEGGLSAYNEVLRALDDMNSVTHGIVHNVPQPTQRKSSDSISSLYTVREIKTASKAWSPPMNETGASVIMPLVEGPNRDKGRKLPTLADVLDKKTTKPYGLFEFYAYMRDVQGSIDYLDFWLDISKHLHLYREYIKVKSKSRALGTLPRREDFSMMVEDFSVIVEKTSLTASAETILYTFLRPGCEREIYLPQHIVASVTYAIEKEKRNDPDVFEDAWEYVFLAMNNDAFPGFLESGKPLYRGLRKAFGPLANGFMPRTGPAAKNTDRPGYFQSNPGQLL